MKRALLFPFALAAAGCATRAAEPPPRSPPSLYAEPERKADAPAPSADAEKELAAMLAAQIRITTVMALALRVGTAVWQVSHSGCPSATDVVAAHLVPDRVGAEDAWGTPYRILCGTKGPTVVSAGPDKAFDTKDDIVIGDGGPTAALALPPARR